MTLPEFLAEDSLGWVHITGHRIGLMDLLHFYNEGYSPEMLLAEYSTLSLPLIHKVIAFYLENRDAVDAYVAACQKEMDTQRASSPAAPTMAELRRRHKVSESWQQQQFLST
jgi:uncharacterized protein (DUF433 family)